MMRDPLEKWTLQDATDLYNIRNWGKGYFSINKRGCVAVHPYKDPEQGIDLKELVDQLVQRGIELPILLRFSDILRHRIGELHDAFSAAINEYQYRGRYRCVYPIKVNQQRQVVEEILDFGKPYGYGLECGSKPELLAVLALTHGSDVPIVCNGFKDDDYLEMIVFSQKIGKTVIPVIEKFNELETVLRYAERLGVRPILGVRVKPSARGSGRWRLSGGERSKFGLTATELLRALEILRDEGKLDCLQLLHFHLGSQITNIHRIKNAITELARLYVEVYKAGAAVRYLDVGGGLGVDYDGSQTDFESSVNYTLQEYANDVVFRVKTVCDEMGVPHPDIVSESGRAIVAYHSVLVFNVLGVSRFVSNHVPEELPEDVPPPLRDLHAIYREVSKKNLLESYHDLVQAYDDVMNLFNLGFLSLELRSLAERLYYSATEKIIRIVRSLDYVPEELEGIEDQLSDTYFCNFSVFQSIPDSWAVQQLFPIMPIHRLREEPKRHGILADITCDSDGKVDKFIDLKDVKRALELHDLDGKEYLLAAFLVGAYQEILGDLHNLFGDTNSVHVSMDESGNPIVETVVKGDTVQEVLSYVQYSPGELVAQIRKDVEAALREKRITLEEAARFLKFYEAGMQSYTYLTPRSEVSGHRPSERFRRKRRRLSGFGVDRAGFCPRPACGLGRGLAPAAAGLAPLERVRAATALRHGKAEHAGRAGEGQTHHVVVAPPEPRDEGSPETLDRVGARLAERLAARHVVRDLARRELAEEDFAPLELHARLRVRFEEGDRGPHRVLAARELLKHASRVSRVARLSEEFLAAFARDRDDGIRRRAALAGRPAERRARTHRAFANASSRAASSAGGETDSSSTPSAGITSKGIPRRARISLRRGEAEARTILSRAIGTCISSAPCASARARRFSGPQESPSLGRSEREPPTTILRPSFSIFVTTS